MTYPLDIVLHAEARETLNGAGELVPVEANREVADLILDVDDIDGALQIFIETTLTNNDWVQLGSTITTTAVKGERIFAFDIERGLRVRWELQGVSAKFTVAGRTQQTYIDMRDMEQSVPANMFAAMPPEVLAHAMLDATDEAASYLRANYTLPLVSWEHDLRLMVGKMAFYHAMCRRGYNPDNIDVLIRQNYLDAISWLKSTAKYATIVDSTPTETEAGAYMVSAPPRGWYPW